MSEPPLNGTEEEQEEIRQERKEKHNKMAEAVLVPP